MIKCVKEVCSDLRLLERITIIYNIENIYLCIYNYKQHSKLVTTRLECIINFMCTHI